jgi:23S rRNA-intervening sequence protein
MNTTHSDYSKLEIPVIVKLFVVYEITHKLIFTFPKHERYTLGEKIERTILDMMELLITANSVSVYEKEKLLTHANAKNELLKILFRTALNINILEARIYLDVETKLQETGRMTQGWIKYARNAK